MSEDAVTKVDSQHTSRNEGVSPEEERPAEEGLSFNSFRWVMLGTCLLETLLIESSSFPSSDSGPKQQP